MIDYPIDGVDSFHTLHCLFLNTYFKYFISLQNKREPFFEYDGFKSNSRLQHEPSNASTSSRQSLNTSMNSPPMSPGNSQHQYQSNSTKLLLEQILSTTRNPDKLPMIVKPSHGGYWIDCGQIDDEDEVDHSENFNDDNNNNSHHEKFDNDGEVNRMEIKIETNDLARCFRQHFYGREHSNLIGFDDTSTLR